MKKIISLVLALAMVMAVAVASAASITINRDSSAESGTTSGTEFTYYEIMKADLSALDTDDYDSNGAPKSDAKVTYYVTKSALASALDALTTTSGTDIFRVTRVGETDRWNVELVATSISGADLATALDVDAVKNNAETNGTFTLTGASVTKDGLDAGYYLFKASNGTVLAAQTLASVTINEKNTYPGIDKKIRVQNGETIDLVNESDEDIGDTVNYSVPVEIPVNVANKDIVVTDKMFKGLTLQTTSLAAENNATPAETITGLSFSEATVEGDYNIYTVTIPAATVFANAGKTITLTYSAILNDQAVINGSNPNTVKLTYDNYTSSEHTVTSKTHKIEVKKTVADGETRLAGVKFTLTRLNGTATEFYQTKNGDNSVWTTSTTEFETTATGNIVFDGVDAGTYTLTETYTPAGYNPLTAPISVTVAADGTVTYTSTDPHNTASGATAADAVIPVINHSGTTLPSTGGIGTTIFYIVGGMLLVGAAIVLVARRKASEN